MQQRRNIDALVSDAIGDNEVCFVNAQFARAFNPPLAAKFREAAQPA